MFDPESRAWSLMTKTRKGVLSILRDLTLAECRQAYHRLNPEYGQTHTMIVWEGGDASGLGRCVDDNEMEIREVFGPPDWDASEVSGWDDPWPKLHRIELDDPMHPRNQRRVEL